MKLFEINAALEELLNQQDPETGELTCDLDQLDALMMERDEKLEGLALYCKNADAEAKAIREEEKTLAERRRRTRPSERRVSWRNSWQAKSSAPRRWPSATARANRWKSAWRSSPRNPTSGSSGSRTRKRTKPPSRTP